MNRVQIGIFMFYYKNANISNTVRMVHLIHRNNVNGIIEICSYGNQYLTSDLSINPYMKKHYPCVKKQLRNVIYMTSIRHY